MGFISPSAGDVRVYGLTPSEIGRSGLIGYLPQRSAYNADFPLSVYDVVAMSRYARASLVEKLGADDREAIDLALERVEMQDRRAAISEAYPAASDSVFLSRAHSRFTPAC